MIQAFEPAALAFWAALNALIAPALVFAGVALFAGGAEALRKARGATGEVTTNLKIYLFDALFIGPALALLIGPAVALIAHAPLTLAPRTWAHTPPALTLIAALFAGDFIGYWRHRLEHTPLLWPAHAVHHSDTAMTWTTLHRFHPINRLTTTVIDSTALALIGLPPWAVIANALARHYYGMFIHMDLAWTYGPLGRVFVSPAMHRWHHVREGQGVGANFATLFSVFDQAFGTFHAPGPCAAPLGVPGGIPNGALGQLWHPFGVWLGALARYVTGVKASFSRSKISSAPSATP